MCSLFSFFLFFLDFQKQEGVLCAMAFRLLYDLIKKRLSRPDSWENLLVKSAYTCYFILFLNY